MMVINTNQNDMDPYFWQTGQRWSADDRPEEPPLPVEKRRELEFERFGFYL